MRFSTNQFGLSLVLVIIKWSASRRCMLCLSMKVRPELPSSGYCYEWNKFQSETSFNVVGSLLGFTVGKEEEQVFGGSHSLPNIWCGGNSPIISSLRGEIWQVESFAHNINKAEVFLAVKQSNLTFVKSTPAVWQDRLTGHLYSDDYLNVQAVICPTGFLTSPCFILFGKLWRLSRKKL